MHPTSNHDSPKTLIKTLKSFSQITKAVAQVRDPKPKPAQRKSREQSLIKEIAGSPKTIRFFLV